MSNTYTGLAAGSLKLERYNNFRGVDFTDENVSLSRSPDSLNMWKNYKTLGKRVETRPGLELQLTRSNTIYGLFFYNISNVDHMIIHEGVKLIDYNPNTQTSTVIKASGMNLSKSEAFVFNNILFIKDGLNYLEYNGTTLKNVEGTVPNIAIHNMISGETKMIQEANLLTDYCTEEYIPDGEKVDFPLSQKGVTNVTVWDISNVTPTQITTGYTTDLVNGVVTFTTAPTLSTSASIKIKYMKESNGANIVKKCKLSCLFDNRVFFAGNQDYPNMLIWCGLNDPRYIGITSYATQGSDVSQIKALVPGNNALWVFKEPSQENTTIFYNVPLEVYDSKLEQTVKTYSSSHSSISTGCKATGINFNDDIVFFSDRGLEGISSDITTEQVISHRSTLIDRKLLTETNYKNLLLAEWEGYLIVVIGKNVYLADSNQKVVNNDHYEYEWFYWELEKDISFVKEHNGVLYFCSKEEENENNSTESYIYTLTDLSDNRELNSYWTTIKDDFSYPQMLKTTNKKGFKSDVFGSSIKIESKIDNNSFKELGTFQNTKGYIVTKIKEKKWNKIQLKFSSTKPFGLYEVTLEAYIGSYVKR